MRVFSRQAFEDRVFDSMSSREHSSLWGILGYLLNQSSVVI